MSDYRTKNQKDPERQKGKNMKLMEGNVKSCTYIWKKFQWKLPFHVKNISMFSCPLATLKQQKTLPTFSYIIEADHTGPSKEVTVPLDSDHVLIFILGSKRDIE